MIDDETLELGPYCGEPTEHTRIKVGHGVCGTAVAEDNNQIVIDVRQLDNYIACSLKTRSEIVVLVKDNGKVVGQFDIDSDIAGNFSGQDERLLKQLAEALALKVSQLRAQMCRSADQKAASEKSFNTEFQRFHLAQTSTTPVQS